MAVQQSSLVIRETDVADILSNISPANFLGQGSAGSVYRFNYYDIPAVVKVSISEDKKESIKREIVIYNYVCKIFNRCGCQNNIVQMLGYDMKRVILVLEYFDGSDLAKYTNYPMHTSTFYTHRLLPRKHPGSADFLTLSKYLHTSTPQDTITVLFNRIYTGLLCLHRIGVLHKDFELKNILIRSDGKVGITDFGLSQIIGREILNGGADSLWRGFKYDLNSVGPMMGNFLDSANPEPYQYRLDRGPIDNIPILDELTSILIQDAFLLLIYTDIATFVSFIYYVNLHTDAQDGRGLIMDLIGMANETIDTEVPENERNLLYLYESEIDLITDTIYDMLVTEPGLGELVQYFRRVINRIFQTLKLDEISSDESVHIAIKRRFGSNYMAAITGLVEQFRYGFLLKNFDLFLEVYRI